MKDLDFIDNFFEPTNMTSDWRDNDNRFQFKSALLGSMVRQGVILKAHVYEFCDYAISQGYGESYSHLCVSDLNAADQFIKRRYDEWVDHVL